MNNQTMRRNIARIIVFIYVKRLKYKACRRAKKIGVQHFVVKWQGKIIIINKTQFKRNRQKGLFPKSFTADNVKKIALYYTKKQ